MSTTMEAAGMTVATEVVAQVRRRRFTAAEKLRILQEADACTQPGELGALLRREGVYSSYLSAWRTARRRGALAGLTPRRRGPQPQRPDPRDRKIVELERENRRLQARLVRAEGLIEVQKKVSRLLDLPLGSDTTD
jgi:transposase